MLLVMFVFGIIMSVELRTEEVAAEDGDEEEYNQVGGFIDWIPGVSTAKAAFNHATGNHVANAVKFTNANATMSSLAVGVLTGGASFVTKIMANPVKSNSFQKIAADDKLWEKYCTELSKTNKVVTCSVLGGLRKQLQQIHEDATSTGPREEKKVSILNRKDWFFKGKPKTEKFKPIH